MKSAPTDAETMDLVDVARDIFGDFLADGEPEA
jgi:hypothetical protein